MSNTIPKAFFVFLISIIIQQILIFRFEELSIDESQVEKFIFNFNITTLIFIFGVIRFNNLLNPITLICLFMFSLSYSFIKLSTHQIELSSKTLYILYLSVFFYLLFASFKKIKTAPTILVNFSPSTRKNLLIGITIFGFIVYVFECLKSGYIPIFSMTSKNTYDDAVANVFTFFHYAVIILTAVPAWAYILYKEKIILKKMFIRISFVATFVTFNYLSKQTILFFMICSLCVYLLYNKINIKRYLNISIILVSVMLSVNYLRISSFDQSNVTDSTQFLKDVAGIESYKNVNLTEAMLIEYSSKRFSALEDMREYTDYQNFLGLGIYTLKPFTSLLFLEKTGTIKVDPRLDSITRVGTFVIDPYMDFGLIGVVILSSFYGFLTNRYYYQYLDNFRDAPIKYAVMIQFLVMAVFINYMNTFFVWTVFFINKLVIGGLNSSKNN